MPLWFFPGIANWKTDNINKKKFYFLKQLFLSNKCKIIFFMPPAESHREIKFVFLSNSFDFHTPTLVIHG